jgi:hypothetical protein
MSVSWRYLPGRGLNKKREKKMKTTRCTVCKNETYQKDGICVLCRSYVTKTYNELIDLLTVDKKCKLRRANI